MNDNGRIESAGGIEPEVFSPANGYEHAPSLARVRRKISTNIILFIATLFTTIFAGAMLAEVNPVTHPHLLYRGIPFSLTLMGILLSHELGHYLMSRRHNVDATLPYFIPAPTFVGTFGAVIKVNSNVPDRRALLDIGASGPIIGFLFSIPALVIGFELSYPVPDITGGINFGSSILLEVLAGIFFSSIPDGYAINLHPIALAGWIGLLVTMMNLLPVGMMDGGHISYALFGRRHYHISVAVVVVLLVMGIYGWFGWAIWGMLNMAFGLRHPPPTHPHVPLDGRRKLIGAAAAVIFIVTFVPMPFSVV
ncbi:MAG: site-2 protease family protein [Candidatus Abyssobacteria bacterium SURF_5]|uniref:Site-2 protease family protein n=1 Tax=Abyssobacteria bacterium (strain SURF_5) TaxID=2093360 RepID=A0A3A4MV60_ABYX5|nr:MAG: site-2 protease family protein [Candidatus Abyssubacteria bacterium SURF_5]